MTDKIITTPQSVKKKTLSKQEKQDYYRAWEVSGMRKTDFCKKNGLFINELYYWHKLFKKKSSTDLKPFSPVIAKMNASDLPQNMACIEMRLPNQAQLSIKLDKNQLCSFIQELMHAVTVIR